MTATDLEAQCQTLLHFWNQGKRSANELHALTNIPNPTIYYNLRKLKKNCNVEHKKDHENYCATRSRDRPTSATRLNNFVEIARDENYHKRACKSPKIQLEGI